MSNPDLLISVLVSACLGALVGLIRQWSDQTEHEDAVDLGGVRTYTFWAMLGCLGAFLGPREQPVVLIVILVLVGAHQVATTVRSGLAQKTGGTTFASALLTVLVGALVFWQHRQTAIVLAATTMVLLGMKQTIHAWTRAFTLADIRATLQFAAITGVILPLVPDRAMGPYGAFNPYSTWLMVVLISGLGFAGYIAVRLLGARAGILVTSLFGGLASSTATTLAFSRRSKEEPELSENYAMAVVAACTVMLPRVIVAVGVFSPELSLTLIAPFACMALPAVVFGAWLWYARQPGATPVAAPPLANPLNLKMSVKFALIYTAIGFLVKAATQLNVLHSSLLPLSFVSGLTDMDAISLSMAGNIASGTIPLSLAAKAVIVAAVSNSIVKAGLAVSLGAPGIRRPVLVVLGATAVAGVAGMWLV